MHAFDCTYQQPLKYYHLTNQPTNQPSIPNRRLIRNDEGRPGPRLPAAAHGAPAARVPGAPAPRPAPLGRQGRRQPGRRLGAPPLPLKGGPGRRARHRPRAAAFGGGRERGRRGDRRPRHGRLPDDDTVVRRVHHVLSLSAGCGHGWLWVYFGCDLRSSQCP